MTATAEGALRLIVKYNAAAYLRTDWIIRLAALYGGAEALLGKSAAELASDGGIGLEAAERFLRAAEAFDPGPELEKAGAAGASVLVHGGEGYPALLSQIPNPPLAIYVRGSLPDGVPCAGLVGTRRPTPYGARMASRLAFDLAKAGVAVASGMARGIDTACHEAALKAGGRTWAVWGTGLSNPYPPENRKLAERIPAEGGALVSEYPMGAEGKPENFPRRNRIISGLSLATVVVEGDMGSGSLITARCALEQGREVLAVPGPADSPMSVGPNRLIKDGAGLAETALDVIAAFPSGSLFGLGLSGASAGGERPKARALSGDPGAAYEALGPDEGLTADEVSESLGWPPRRTASALFELEAEGLVSLRGARYRRC